MIKKVACFDIKMFVEHAETRLLVGVMMCN
jgi:hypothetical protein